MIKNGKDCDVGYMDLFVCDEVIDILVEFEVDFYNVN